MQGSNRCDQIARCHTQTNNSQGQRTKPADTGRSFFQPAAGHVGSLTDIGYAQNTYDFEVVAGTYHWGGVAGDWKASEIFAKEDLSIGLTDDFALMGMLKYAKTNYEMNWEPYTYNAVAYPASTDSMTDSGNCDMGFGCSMEIL